MPIESASYISNLNTAYPAGGDSKSQGDEHIRLIKEVLKTTFPNLSGAVTLTPEQINAAAHDLNTLNEIFGNGEMAVSSAVFGQGMTQQRVRLGWHTPSGRLRALVGGTLQTGGFVVENDFVGGKQQKGYPGNQEFPGGFYVEMGSVTVTSASASGTKSTIVAFQKRFDAAPFVVPSYIVPIFQGGPLAQDIRFGVHAITRDGFTIDVTDSLGTFVFRWLAVGFRTPS